MEGFKQCPGCEFNDNLLIGKCDNQFYQPAYYVYCQMHSCVEEYGINGNKIIFAPSEKVARIRWNNRGFYGV